MTVRRGDVLLVRFPFTSGTGSKVRPAVVVQCDRNNQRLTNVIIAPITTTTHRRNEPTQLYIEAASATGRQAGLLRDSVVTCENVATIDQSLVLKTIGSLSAAAFAELNDCLKSVLGLT